MLLHLFNDEKIMNRTIQNFEEALPNQNVFVCIMKGDNPKYVSKDLGVIFTDLRSPLKEDLSCVTAVIIHLLFEDKIVFLEQNQLLDRRIFWIEWGMDLYNSLLYHAGYPMYNNYSKRFGRLNFVKYYIKHKLMKKQDPSDLRIINFVKKYVTDVCWCCEEEDAIWKKYIDNKASFKTHIEFFYYPIDEILGPSLIGQEAQGNVILVGNSGSVTNNHEYVFKYLKKTDLADKKIVCPLSYGGWSERERKSVGEKGKAIFGEKFNPLYEFLPLSDYNQLQLSSEIGLYGSWRQEAEGNILVGLYLGAKIFMSNKSPMYLGLKRLGLVVYEIESISTNKLHTKLTETEKQRNRRIIMELFNKENQIEGIRKIWGNC